MQEVWQGKRMSYKYFHLTFVLYRTRKEGSQTLVCFSEKCFYRLHFKWAWLYPGKLGNLLFFSGPYANCSALKKVRPYAVCWSNKGCEVCNYFITLCSSSKSFNYKEFYLEWLRKAEEGYSYQVIHFLFLMRPSHVFISSILLVKAIFSYWMKLWPSMRPSSFDVESFLSSRSWKSSHTEISLRKCKHNKSYIFLKADLMWFHLGLR